MKNIITVKVRLFAGLDSDVNVDDYDRHEGIALNIPQELGSKKW